jgi:hypothetical protein
MQQIMASIIIRKTVEIKRHFKSVTNLAKFKRYTAKNGALILQNYMHIGRGCEECERHLSLNFVKK